MGMLSIAISMQIEITERSSKARKLGFPLLLLVLCGFRRSPQDLASFEKRVTVNKLPNGLTSSLQAARGSVFSFATWVDSG